MTDSKEPTQRMGSGPLQSNRPAANSGRAPSESGAPTVPITSPRQARGVDEPGPWGNYFRNGLDPLTSLVFALPLFVFYQIGILLIDRRTGVDFVSGLMLSLIEQSTSLYIIVVLTFCAAMSVALWTLQKSRHLVPTAFAPAILESVVWAMALFALGNAMIAPTQSAMQDELTTQSPNLLEALVLAAGAGFHEEVIFRVIAFAGLAFLLRRLGANRVASWLIAGVVSSLLYGFVHKLGLDAQAFTFAGLAFRILSGAGLAAVYYFRGFAVAAYAHAVYELISMLGSMDRS